MQSLTHAVTSQHIPKIMMRKLGHEHEGIAKYSLRANWKTIMHRFSPIGLSPCASVLLEKWFYVRRVYWNIAANLHQTYRSTMSFDEVYSFRNATLNHFTFQIIHDSWQSSLRVKPLSSQCPHHDGFCQIPAHASPSFVPYHRQKTGWKRASTTSSGTSCPMWVCVTAWPMISVIFN